MRLREGANANPCETMGRIRARETANTPSLISLGAAAVAVVARRGLAARVKALRSYSGSGSVLSKEELGKPAPPKLGRRTHPQPASKKTFRWVQFSVAAHLARSSDNPLWEMGLLVTGPLTFQGESSGRDNQCRGIRGNLAEVRISQGDGPEDGHL